MFVARPNAGLLQEVNQLDNVHNRLVLELDHSQEGLVALKLKAGHGICPGGRQVVGLQMTKVCHKNSNLAS